MKTPDIVADCKILYPDWFIDTSVIRAYTRNLADLLDSVVAEALHAHARLSAKPPTIAEWRQRAIELMPPEPPEESEPLTGYRKDRARGLREQYEAAELERRRALYGGPPPPHPIG